MLIQEDLTAGHWLKFALLFIYWAVWMIISAGYLRSLYGRSILLYIRFLLPNGVITAPITPT